MAMHSNDRGQTWSAPADNLLRPVQPMTHCLISDHHATWLIWNTADQGLNVIRLSK